MPSLKASVIVLIVLALIVGAAPSLAAANDVTIDKPMFYRDVLPIMQQNCQVCHRAGGANLGGMVAPMSFTSYQDVRPWAKAIARQVDARTMPPWHASPNQHGIFTNERTLDDSEIATLVRWASIGAPAGDAADAPPAREWPFVEGGWITGKPDLELIMPERYFVEDEVEDIYVNFVTPITEEMLPEERWVKSIEYQPGSSVVHHIVAPPLGGIAPGNQPTVYSDGYGSLLKPGDEVRWSMHYHKEPGTGTGVWDQSRINIQFYPAGYTPDHVVVVDTLAKMDFVIPAGDPNVVYTTRMSFERDSLLLGLLPHMHLRGKSAKYVAFYPDGNSEVLLEVPKYDFNWQTSYEYPTDTPKQMPAGTEIEFTASWDNSADNPDNPDPTIEVVFGEPTTAEMMFGFVSYSDAEPGYVPKGRGWLSNIQITPEFMKRMLKQRGIDFDELSPEEQQQMLERFGLADEGSAEGQSSVGQ